MEPLGYRMVSMTLRATSKPLPRGIALYLSARDASLEGKNEAPYFVKNL